MNNEGALYKLWRIVYPLLIYFLLDLVIVWAAEALMAIYTGVSPGSWAAHNIPTIAAIIFLLVSIVICWQIYQKDLLMPSDFLYKHPGYFGAILIAGMLASHGLSLLVSVLDIDSIIGNYTEIENQVFTASPILVIIQTVLLAPLSEELLFRGIIFNRLKMTLRGFWLPALISAAIFGIYHLNLAQGVFAFLFGIFACAVYDCFANLWAPVVLHIGGNLISVILVYTGFSYPREWMFITVMIVSLAAAWVIYHFIFSGIKGRIEQ